MTPAMLRYLALSYNEAYTVILHPSLALECIVTLLTQGYSLHIKENEAGTAVIIRIKKKEKQTVNISNKAKRMLECVMQ